jgi:tetratricopeptide (TPR) repeat protein
VTDADRGGDGGGGSGASAEALLERASMLLEIDRWREALGLLSSHLASNPDDVRALCLAAHAHAGLEEWAACVAASRRALALDPDDEWAWRLLSEGHEGLGEHDASRSAAERARAAEPDEWRTYARIVLADIAADRLSTATERAALEAVRLAPDEADTHFLYGNVALQQQRYELAERAYRNALQISPQHAGAANNLALARLRQGDTGAAAATFVDLLADDPRNDLARSNVLVTADAVVGRVQLLLFAALFGSGYLLVAIGRDLSHGATGADPAFVVGRFLVLALALVALAVFVLRFVRGVGGRLGRVVTAVRRFDRPLAHRVVVVAAAYLVFVVAAFLPLVPSLVALGVALVMNVVARAIPSRR